MKASLLCLPLFILLSFSKITCSFAQLQSRDASINRLTGAPGNQLSIVFGHSAIRIKDSSRSLDVIFNYGTSGFDMSNFYLRFLSGRPDYMLSIEQCRGFEYVYTYLDQRVSGQIFNLNSGQKQKV